MKLTRRGYRVLNLFFIIIGATPILLYMAGRGRPVEGPILAALWAAVVMMSLIPLRPKKGKHRARSSMRQRRANTKTLKLERKNLQVAERAAARVAARKVEPVNVSMSDLMSSPVAAVATKGSSPRAARMDDTSPVPVVTATKPSTKKAPGAKPAAPVKGAKGKKLQPVGV